MGARWVLVTLALAATSTAEASSPRWGIRGRADATFGAAGDVGVHRASAPLAHLEGRVVPSFSVGALRLALPLAAEHLERVADPYDRSAFDATLVARLRVASGLRLAVDAGLRGELRVGWPDSLQPRGDVLLPTDRFTHLDRALGATVTYRPAKGHTLALRGYASLSDGVDDPRFLPIDWPDHIAPTDHAYSYVRLEYARRAQRWAVRAEVLGYLKSYFFRFAEDAGTGVTHASPGGAPPNPLRELYGLVPAVSAEWRPNKRWRLAAGYALAATDDAFAGYRSSLAHRPSIEVELRARGRVTVTAKAQLEHKVYGPNSYALSAGHPPLDEGDRRRDDHLDLDLEATAPLAPHLWLLVQASGRVRWTNFPDYVPGVHPESRRYDIDWDYEEWTTRLGVRVTF